MDWYGMVWCHQLGIIVFHVIMKVHAEYTKPTTTSRMHRLFQRGPAFFTRRKDGSWVDVPEPLPGVYGILISGTWYVGSSQDVLGRLKGHLSRLSRGVSKKRLQKAWKGPEYCECYFLQGATDELCRKSWEDRWIEKLSKMSSVSNRRFNTRRPVYAQVRNRRQVNCNVQEEIMKAVLIGLTVLAGLAFATSSALANPDIQGGCAFVLRNGGVASFNFPFLEHEEITLAESNNINSNCKVDLGTGDQMTFDKSNTGFQCFLTGTRGTIEGTDDWQEVISADGQTTLTCKFHPSSVPSP